MNKTPTYKEQFDKITEAYIKGEIRPYDARFCFCGTLCDSTSRWFAVCGEVHLDYGVYTGRDYVAMENALLDKVWMSEHSSLYEDALFEGMCNALEVLKQIHISKGEIIDEVPAFTKRELIK